MADASESVSDKEKNEDPDDCDDEEYNVEEIREKRTNPETGIVEYLIKWENYDESQNSWEPTHNVNCPDLILKFEEKLRESAKRKRRKSREYKPKRTKVDKIQQRELLIVEDDVETASVSTEELSTGQEKSKDLSEPTAIMERPKGFARGLKIERIVGCCTDEDDKIWFFVKWQGANELELVEAIELEDKAPRELCLWYKERLYYAMKVSNEERQGVQLKAN